MTLNEVIAYLNPEGSRFLFGAAWTAIGGVGGFLVSRFTLSKAERKTVEQQMYENADKHAGRRAEKYKAFSDVLLQYCNKADAPTLDDFFAISTAGDNYFNELRAIADAVLAGKIDKGMRDNTFVPDVHLALQKNVPLYYETLTSIAEKVGLTFNGGFERKNFESMYLVVEKFGLSLDNAPVATLAGLEPT